MRIYDSNLLIYSFQPAYSFLQADFLQANAYLSNITKLEVLGYQLISQAEKNYFERLFTLTNFLQIDDVIINEAINLRQMRWVILSFQEDLNPILLMFSKTDLRKYRWQF